MTARPERNRRAGFSLPELLVVLVIVGTVAAGIVEVFATQSRTYVRQDAAVSLEENLRVSLAMVTDALRLAGCGVPAHGLDGWIPWVDGFNDSPVLLRDGGDGPDELTVAACTPVVARLSADAAAGATTLSLESAVGGKGVEALLNAADKSLLWIGDAQHAAVRAVSGDAVEIDTDPFAPGDQGLLRPFLAGTPVTRVDVTTFRIRADRGGAPYLAVDRYHGNDQRIADGVSDLQVEAVVPRHHYRVDLTATNQAATGEPITHAMSAAVDLRNG